MSYLIVSCPHCQQFLFVDMAELNCRIFRCGVYKQTFVQISPHLDKISCDMLKKNDLIYGCAKPFKINNNNECIICDYI